MPDRLELSYNETRLGCLTGATKRLGFAGRFDDRALLGFLRQLLEEARAGLALLEGLEALIAQFAALPSTWFRQSSGIAHVLYSFLVLPAVEAKCLEASLGFSGRVVRKFVRRLADAGVITA